eukprot:jgi/Mesen1/9624/ME000669S09065
MVFEAETIYLAKKYKPKIFNSEKQGPMAPMLCLLAAIKDSNSNHRSQVSGWGVADRSPLYFKGHIQLKSLSFNSWPL